MSEGVRIPFELARKISVDTCYKLQPYCDVINIVGSIRRKKETVGDIEIICVPKVETLESRDLFGGKHVDITRRDSRFVEAIGNVGALVKGNIETGRYINLDVGDGIRMDIFMPQPEDYWRQYVIRTGSAEYVRDVIASRWKAKGWCGTSNGLRLIRECIENKGVDGKSKWVCIVKKPNTPPVWESEQDFFRWLNLEWVHPANR